MATRESRAASSDRRRGYIRPIRADLLGLLRSAVRPELREPTAFLHCGQRLHNPHLHEVPAAYVRRVRSGYGSDDHRDRHDGGLLERRGSAPAHARRAPRHSADVQCARRRCLRPARPGRHLPAGDDPIAAIGLPHGRPGALPDAVNAGRSIRAVEEPSGSLCFRGTKGGVRRLCVESASIGIRMADARCFAESTQPLGHKGERGVSMEIGRFS